MGAWEIQRALGLARTRAREIMHRKGFPDPVDDTLRMGSVWYEDEVMAWIAEHRPRLAEDPEGE
jgi:predicted DNA-binding transcriptional regulator AlpA